MGSFLSLKHALKVPPFGNLTGEKRSRELVLPTADTSAPRVLGSSLQNVRVKVERGSFFPKDDNVDVVDSYYYLLSTPFPWVNNYGDDFGPRPVHTISSEPKFSSDLKLS